MSTCKYDVGFKPRGRTPCSCHPAHKRVPERQYSRTLWTCRRCNGYIIVDRDEDVRVTSTMIKRHLSRGDV